MRKSKSSSRSSSSVSSEYEYVGRLVTRERPISSHQNTISRSVADRYDYFTSSDEDVDDLSKPLGVIRINDRHIREIYRIPTPPPEIKRVFHRLRSPKPKVIERIFVLRPAPEIVENIIEVPPEKVRIINREKHLRPSKPIIRTKVIYLEPHHHHQAGKNQQPRTTFQYSPQPNPSPVNYTQSIHSQPPGNPHIVQPTHYTYGSPPIPPNYFPQYSPY